MPVFAFSIAADQNSPPEGDGYVRAETIQAAVALVEHPEVNVYLTAPMLEARPVQAPDAPIRARLILPY